VTSAEQMSRVEVPVKSLIALQIILWEGHIYVRMPVLKPAGLNLEGFVMGLMLKYIGESNNE